MSPVIECLSIVFEYALRSLRVLFEFLFRTIRFVLLRVLDVVCVCLTIATIGRTSCLLSHAAGAPTHPLNGSQACSCAPRKASP